MYSFKNDYSEGAHPNILNRLVVSNLEQTTGYGEDSYTLEAEELLKKEIGNPNAQIHLLSGGTQVNLTAISAFLRPHEAAIAVHTGHIFTHETGAIEATGHKVIAMVSEDGKMTPGLVQEAVDMHTDEHMVKPKLVYISNSTEIGTIYSKEEIVALSEVCKANNLIFYMDGARLGSALCARDNDVTMQDIASYVDAFYIGGTKNGALIGEALIIINDKLKSDFRYFIKQKGGLLAKGRLLGIQFVELFKDGLFYQLAEHANKMASLLQEGIEEAGYPFMIPSPSNQIFPILPNTVIAELEKKYSFIVWKKVGGEHSVIRLVTSWATPEEAVCTFIHDLKIINR